MPLTGAGKREYQRLYMKAYMRKRRLGFAKARLSADPSPQGSPPLDVKTPKNKRALRPDIMLSYMNYINARGYTLAFTTLGYELVDMATGQIGQGGEVSIPIYQQRPTERVLREVASLKTQVKALQERMTLHEAEDAVEKAESNFAQ